MTEETLDMRIARLRASAPKRRTPKPGPDRFVSVRVSEERFERLRDKAVENGFGDSVTGWVTWLIEEHS